MSIPTSPSEWVLTDQHLLANKFTKISQFTNPTQLILLEGELLLIAYVRDELGYIEECSRKKIEQHESCSIAPTTIWQLCNAYSTPASYLQVKHQSDQDPVCDELYKDILDFVI
jgi:hypothetical protein